MVTNKMGVVVLKTGLKLPKLGVVLLFWTGVVTTQNRYLIGLQKQVLKKTGTA